MFKFSFLLVLLFSVFSSHAACKINADVYFINGVNAPDEAKVRENSEFLEASINRHRGLSGIKQVTYLYNQSQGLMMDVLYEQAQLKSAERNMAVGDMFEQISLSAFNLPSTISEGEQTEVRQRVNTVITSPLSAHAQAQVTEFSQRVSTDSLLSGVQAILVPHSQGNMFANAVYEKLKLELTPEVFSGLAVVGVASPAAFAPSSLYVTVNQDLVIRLLASAQSILTGTLPPLPANLDASAIALTRALGHGFTDVYLADDLQSNFVPSKSVAAVVIMKIDIAIGATSTVLSEVSRFVTINGVKYIRPGDSTVNMSCFNGTI